MILLLYVDDMFLTGEEKLILDAKMKLSTKFEMKYLGMMQWYLPWSRNLSTGDSEEIQYAVLQGNGHTYGIELEATP